MKRSKLFFGIFILMLLLLPAAAVYADDTQDNGEIIQEESTPEETEHIHVKTVRQVIRNPFPL